MRYVRNLLPIIPPLVIALGVLASWLIYKGPADMTGRSSVTITLTNGAFVPDQVFVSRGTTVTFRSTDPYEFWPASDLHPFHTIYPEFDPKRPVSPSGSWSFTLTKDGRWSFHNHMNPVEVGAIIVIPPGAKASEKYDVLAPCDQKEIGGRAACWKEHVMRILDLNGLEAAFDTMAALWQSDPHFGDQCHLFLHDLGLAAYGKYGDDVPLSPKMNYCGQGFFHGYMEGFLQHHHGDIGAASAFCANVQKKFGASDVLLGPQCFHGIGHGIMEYYLVSRPVLSVKQNLANARAACGTLSTDDERFRCASGDYAVTKDWINLQGLQSRYTELFSPRDPYAACKEATSTWDVRACAWELSKEVVIQSGYDAAATFARIRSGGKTIENGAYIDPMVESAAFLMGEWVSRSNAELAAQCEVIASPDLRYHCVLGIELGIMFNAEPGKEITRSAGFCRSP